MKEELEELFDQQKEREERRSSYERLEIDFDQLVEQMDGDIAGAAFKALKLEKALKKSPEFKSGRWWHAFHFTDKKTRMALRLDGEKIYEAFDVAGADLHFLCKAMEESGKFDTPLLVEELVKFEKEVKEDFRKKFGTSKATGKCYKRVKLAVKLLVNGRRAPVLSEDETLEEGVSKINLLKRSILSSKTANEISQWLSEKFPHVFMFFGYDNSKLWLKLNEIESKVVSEDIFRRLKEIGVAALPLHDAVYLKESDIKKKIDVKKMFYDSLGLLVDKTH